MAGGQHEQSSPKKHKYTEEGSGVGYPGGTWALSKVARVENGCRKATT